MGIVDAVAQERRRRERAWPVGQGSTYDHEQAFGHDSSEFSPEEYGDYLVTSNEVFSAAMLRARQMGSLELKLYDRDGPDRREVTTGPAYELLRHVNPFWTRRRLAMMDDLSMSLWGQTAWAVERRGATPAELWWMKPSRLRPVPDSRKYLKGFLYWPIAGGDPIPFTPDEVVWFRYPNPLDEFSPLSPLAAARLAADTASAMMKSNRSLFTNGMQAGGVIVPPEKMTFSPEQARDLEKLFDRRMRGVDKAHRWSVFRFEAQLKQLNVTPKDAEFVAGLQLTLRQVANALGPIPVTLLNDHANATLTNAREHKLLLWEHALMPDSGAKAEEIVEQLFPMFPTGQRPGHAEYDYSKVPALKEASAAAWLQERQELEVGAKTINEWRKSKGLAPVAWGDTPFMPVNKAPLTDEGDFPATATTTASAQVVDGDDARALLAVFSREERR